MNKNYNFSEVLSTLTDYTEENTGLVGTAVYNSPTFSSGIDIIPGIPGAAVELNIVDDDIYFQTNSCGFTTSGNTTFTQVNVPVCDLKLNEQLCPITFKKKWYGQLMSGGSTPEDFPFSQFVVDHKSNVMAAEVERLFWQGDITFGSGGLEKCDGMAAFLSGKTNGYTAAASGATTSTNAVAKVNTLISALDERVLTTDVVFFTSFANFNNYIQGLITGNYYHFMGNINSGEITVPGYPNIKIIATSGLRGTTYWYGSKKDNFTLVTNLEKEFRDIELLWDKEEREIRLYASLGMGAGSAQPNLVVHNNENCP